MSAARPALLAPGGPVAFPADDAALREPDGLIAIGGDLSPQRLLAAYRRGIFPWYEEGQPVLWWTPDPRLVLYPERFHLGRTLRKRLRKNDFAIRADTAFAEVVGACAAPRPGQPRTWITPAMVAAYVRLHEMGIAHSLEVWMGESLVGGLYGIALGAVFFGESMFSRATDASKLALHALCRRMRASEAALIDCQVASAHLLSLGAELVSRRHFVGALERALAAPSPWDGPAAPR